MYPKNPSLKIQPNSNRVQGLHSEPKVSSKPQGVNFNRPNGGDATNNFQEASVLKINCLQVSWVGHLESHDFEESNFLLSHPPIL